MKWLRLESETMKAYQAFCVFVVMHPKTVQEVAKAIRARVSTLSSWLNRHSWEERKAAFLQFLKAMAPSVSTSFGEARGLTGKGTLCQMHARHIEEAMALQKKAFEKFRAIDAETLSNSEVIRFLTAGANLERIARKSSENREEGSEEVGVNDCLAKVLEFMEEV